MQDRVRCKLQAGTQRRMVPGTATNKQKKEEQQVFKADSLRCKRTRTAKHLFRPERTETSANDSMPRTERQNAKASNTRGDSHGGQDLGRFGRRVGRNRLHKEVMTWDSTQTAPVTSNPCSACVRAPGASCLGISVGQKRAR